jgi:hypothetical protein
MHFSLDQNDLLDPISIVGRFFPVHPHNDRRQGYRNDVSEKHGAITKLDCISRQASQFHCDATTRKFVGGNF